MSYYSIQSLLAAQLILITGLISAAAQAEQSSTEDWDKWFEEDFESKTKQVNEGPLHFLIDPVTDKPTHTIKNIIKIHASSLNDQWVSLTQCHGDLDPVAESQIVYGYKAMRGLRITQANRIGKAWIEDQSVQMTDISKGASLCLEADVPILLIQADKTYVIRNGPYYRRFLDGYYPFHVSLDILYPAQKIKVIGITPDPQPGLIASHATGRLTLDAWFEGKLRLAVRFAKHSAN
jgi:hypothetical protein